MRADYKDSTKKHRVTGWIGDLEEAAACLKKEAAYLSECEGNISAAWKGDSAEAYLHKLIAVNSELDMLLSDLLNTIETVRLTADASSRDR